MRRDRNSEEPSCLALFSEGQAISLTGTVAETDLFLFTVPAGLLGASGRLEVFFGASMTNNANAKVIRVYFGGTLMYTQTPVSVAVVMGQAHVQNRGAVNAQVCVDNGSGALITAAVDTSQSVIVRITGQLANAGDVFTLQSIRGLVLR